MKKARTVSFVLPEEKYRLPDRECNEAKLVSVSYTRQPNTFTNLSYLEETDVEICTLSDCESPGRLNSKDILDSGHTVNSAMTKTDATTVTNGTRGSDAVNSTEVIKAETMTRRDGTDIFTGNIKEGLPKMSENNGSTNRTAEKKDDKAITVTQKEQSDDTSQRNGDTASTNVRKEQPENRETKTNGVRSDLAFKNLNPKNKCARIVQKNGQCNVEYVNVPKRNLKFISDYFTSVVEMRWRFLLLLFFSGFIFSWIIFSGLWFSVSQLHGDFDEIAANSTKRTPCIWNADSFQSVLLFSMETQTTIGYGYRYVSEECPAGIIILIFQSLCGLLLQVFLAGSILTKIQVPKKRAKTIAFSKHACISIIQGEPYLMIRIGNLRLSEVVESNLRALFVLHRDLDGNDVRPYILQDLPMGSHGDMDSRLTLWWPTTVFHKIDKSSPLFKMTPATMSKCEFEIIIIMEGVVSTTSMSFQARTSYLHNEILWGFEFAHTFSEDSSSSKFPIDFAHFDEVTLASHSTRLSAEEYLKSPRTERPVDRQSFCVLD